MRGLLMLFTIFVIGYGLIKKTSVFSDFSEGVTDGLRVCLNIFPILLLMTVSVSVFRASGAMDSLVVLFTPLCQSVCVPPQILSLALIRPLSGGGALSVCEDLLSTVGADSLIGRMSSVLSASTETTFYTVSLYLSGKNLSGCGKFLFCALLCDLFTVAVTVFVCNLLF